MSSFKQLPVSDLRAGLPKFKRQVQLGMKRIAATHYGQVVGYLVPLKDVEEIEENGWIKTSEEISLSDFRAKLNECWEKLQFETDCIYLTYHTRKAAAFVSPRLAAHLDIPISEVSHKLFSLGDEVISAHNLSTPK